MPQQAPAKKLFGLGVVSSRLGGAGLGMGAGLVTYTVLHRYHYWQRLAGAVRGSGAAAEECSPPCPAPATCLWGVCECRSGYLRRGGQCHLPSHPALDPPGRPYPAPSPPSPPGLACPPREECGKQDINQVCVAGLCACRSGQSWSGRAGECQPNLSLDCSTISPASPVPPAVTTAARLAAAALQRVAARGPSPGLYRCTAVLMDLAQASVRRTATQSGTGPGWSQQTGARQI